MSTYYVFNGDADGICALHQLRLGTPGEAVLITGVKRDIQLLEKLPTLSHADITVLDINLDQNLTALEGLLDRQCHVRWFDHHEYSSDIRHPHLDLTIDISSAQNTSKLVSAALHHRFLTWAIVGLYGDNLASVAKEMGAIAELSEEQCHLLKECGELLNYNAYGQTLADLHYPPLTVVETLTPFDSPFAMLSETDLIPHLREGLEHDLEQARQIKAEFRNVYLFPDTPWARRVIGEFSNTLVRQDASQPFAVLLDNGNGGFVISVRSPGGSPLSAAGLCKQFPTGGGRVKAAGINCLPGESLRDFIKMFHEYYGCLI